MVDMTDKYETSRALAKHHFSWPYDTPEQGEELIRNALTLCSLGFLNDSYPVSVFAENKTHRMIRYSSSGQLSAFYEELQHEVHALLTGHLSFHAIEDPEVEAIKILSKLSGHQRKACEKGKMLLEWHSKILKQSGRFIPQDLASA